MKPEALGFQREFDGTQPELAAEEIERSAAIFDSLAQNLMTVHAAFLEPDDPVKRLTLGLPVGPGESLEFAVVATADGQEVIKVQRLLGDTVYDECKYGKDEDGVVVRTDTPEGDLIGLPDDVAVARHDYLAQAEDPLRDREARLRAARILFRAVSERARNQYLEKAMGLNEGPVHPDEMLAVAERAAKAVPVLPQDSDPHRLTKKQ
jgi:hypothetical protein